jgi:ABC-type uncharacterized transport system, periplasmic component
VKTDKSYYANTNIVRTTAIGLILCGLTVLCLSTQAQATEGPRRIGYLYAGFKPPKEFFDAMQALGYVDGQNIFFDYRYAEHEQRLAELASDLVHRNISAIVVSGAAAALAAQRVNKTIPIVYLGGGDPVALGLVTSLAHPGRNVTGITELSPELTAKRLELLKEAFAKISRVAVITRAGAPDLSNQLESLKRDARALGLILQIVEVRESGDIEKALSGASAERAGALIEVPDPLFHANSRTIAEYAARNKLPSIFHSKDFVEAGGLMAYGANFFELYRRAANLLDKILKGAKPADLPVEQPTKFELIVNIETAKRIGVTIPPNVLARADKVIR